MPDTPSQRDQSGKEWGFQGGTGGQEGGASLFQLSSMISTLFIQEVGTAAQGTQHEGLTGMRGFHSHDLRCRVVARGDVAGPPGLQGACGHQREIRTSQNEDLPPRPRSALGEGTAEATCPGCPWPEGKADGPAEAGGLHAGSQAGLCSRRREHGPGCVQGGASGGARSEGKGLGEAVRSRTSFTVEKTVQKRPEKMLPGSGTPRPSCSLRHAPREHLQAAPHAGLRAAGPSERPVERSQTTVHPGGRGRSRAGTTNRLRSDGGLGGGSSRSHRKRSSWRSWEPPTFLH